MMLSDMSLNKKILQNTIIQLIGKSITILLALVGFGLVTRYLGQGGFGQFATVYAFLSIFAIVIDLGLQMTTTQLISKPNVDEEKIVNNALTIRLFASLSFLIIAPLIALMMPYPAIVKIGIAVAAIGFVFSSLTATLTGLFQKHLIMQRVASAEIIGKLIFILGIVVTTRFDFGLIGIIVAVIADSALMITILLSSARERMRIQLQFDRAQWQMILRATWPLAITIALNLIYFKGDIVIMSLLQPEAAVGLYGAPYRVLEVLINMIYLFLGLLLPLFTLAYHKKNLDHLKKLVQSSFNIIMIATLPLIVGGVMLGRPLMRFVAGSEFVISGDIIKILLLATGTIFFAGLFGYVIVALEQQKRMIIFYANAAILSVIGYTYFIYHYSYWGAAWMTVATELFILIAALYVVKKQLNFLPKLTIMPPVLAASLIMGGIIALIDQLHVVLVVVIAIALYFSVLYLFGTIRKETLQKLFSFE